MHPGSTDGAAENFLARVQQHAGVTSRSEAERLTRATLNALSENVSGGQMDDLVRRLPEELRPDTAHASGHAAAFDKGAFLDKVSGGIGTVDPEEAERQVSAVLGTVREWAPPEQTADTMAQLPPEFARLFQPPGGQREQ
ncbi:DUF2267 domain-containing protein [Allosalinactinospora lopnorensis]|uniref:DUF2267 domain-containing protein n=1 Tax=Allosalinactinospora lopnorensis TaxID=1352348 RepID=UPI000623FE85|nr:DUF2267 domain-containing protein [Allosalinactinospora lopnorensis]